MFIDSYRYLPIADGVGSLMPSPVQWCPHIEFPLHPPACLPFDGAWPLARSRPDHQADARRLMAASKNKKYEDRLDTHGLFGHYTPSDVMDQLHRHNEIELNFIEQGTFTYLFGGNLVQLPPRRLIIFWAAKPHRIVQNEPNTSHVVLTIPLSWFISWKLPQDFTHAVLQGGVLIEPQTEPGDLDHQLMRLWMNDLKRQEVDLQRAVLLEVEGRLRRLAHSLGESGLKKQAANLHHVHSGQGGLDKVSQMAQFVAEHFREPITVAQIAAAARLHPNYAMNLFQSTCGASLMNYVTAHRITHSQLMLVTTDEKVLTIAYESGFGSASQFYALFKRQCGMSPIDYRNTMQLARQ